MIQASPHCLGSAEMLKAGVPRDGTWSLDEIIPIWRSLEGTFMQSATDLGFCQWVGRTVLRSVSIPELKKYHGPQLREGLARYNYSFLHSGCAELARAELPNCLSSICAYEHGTPLPTGYFAGLLPALFAAMHRHTARVEKEIGQTSVKEKVFQRMNFAADKNFPVMILGDARIGKTASVSTWCKMRPGRARLVTIPEGGRDWDFFAAHADALGIPYTTATSERVLKRAVEFVLAHTRLFLVYDEFHYSLPVRYTRRSVPHRLNWIRSHVVDRGLGCAFFATRQTFNSTMGKFVQETAYQMEQWIGRIAAPLVLASTLEPTDLLNITHAKFPAVDGDVLEMIVGRCVTREETEARQAGQRTAEGAALRYLNQVVSYAQWLAEKAGTDITLEHVEAAWLETVGGEGLPVAAAPARAPCELAASAPRPPRAPRQTHPESVAAPALETNRILDPSAAVLTVA